MSDSSGEPGDVDRAGGEDARESRDGGDDSRRDDVAAQPDFGDSGLLPAVVQDLRSRRVRVLAYMNREALERTLETGRVTFWSRSRGELWEKGETSGNWLEARSVELDCDGDAILVHAVAHGPTCHTGRESCFDARALWQADPEGEPSASVGHGSRRSGPPDDSGSAESRGGAVALGAVLAELADVVADRDRERPEGSYTARLLGEGPGAAGRKVAEEALEVALTAAAGGERADEESADLLYHLLVLWRSLGLDPDEVARVLLRRRGGPGAEGDGTAATTGDPR